MAKYEPVVTKEEDIETAVSCPDQTPVAKKVEDVTPMEHHRRKRPFLKGVFVGVIGTLFVLKLHMVIRHCHHNHHHHPGRHHGDHPPPPFEVESYDFPDDFPDVFPHELPEDFPHDNMMEGMEIKWDEKEMPMWDHEDMLNKKEMWHEKKMHAKKEWHEKKMHAKKEWHEKKKHAKKEWQDKKMHAKKEWKDKKMHAKKEWNEKKMDNHPKDEVMEEPVVEIPLEEEKEELKTLKEDLPNPKVEINESSAQVVRQEESP